MKSNQNPLFRKVIAPWYDSEIACIAVMVFMALVLCFAGLGVSAALDIPDYREYVWVPLLLGAMCLFVLISTAVRLFRRSPRRYGRTGR